MNTNVAVQEAEKRASPIDLYRQQVLPPDRAQDLYRSLPSHISPAIFERNLTNALMANPDLIRFDARLVYREVSKAAGLGLLLDPQLGEAYMVVSYNYKTKNKEPQLRIGYRGMCKLARQTGNVTAIYAHEVCEDDHYDADLGVPKTLHHRPKLFSDRGAVIGYFAVITYKDGTFDFEPMSVAQTRAIRDRSDAWKAYAEKKIKSTPWSTDEDEMAKKTALRRLLKRQDLSPEMRTAIEIEDRAEFPEMRSVNAVVDDGDGPPAPPPPPAQIIEQGKPAGNDAPPPPDDVDNSYITLVEGGRDNGQQEIWADDVPPNDNPPDPNARPEAQQTRSEATGKASPAVPPTHATSAAGEVLLTKGQLLESIKRLKTIGESLTWSHNYENDIGELDGADRREVDDAFNRRQAELSPTNKTKK